MTSNFPFEGEESDVSVIVQIIQGKLPPVHDDGRLDQVTALANLMVDCWSLELCKRPTANSCERQVHWMVRESTSSRSAWLTLKHRIGPLRAAGAEANPLRFPLLTY